MRSTTLILVAVFVALCLPGAAVASVTISQTYTNNSGAYATGFQWWFAPDCTVTGATSSAFSNVATASYPTPAPGMVEVHYTNGTVNGGGGSASFSATLSNNSAAVKYARWENGLAASSTNLPCSFGGYYSVPGGSPDRQWILPIDNPQYTLDDTNLQPIPNLRDMVILNLKYAVTTIQLTPAGLRDFSSSTWTADAGPSGPISPGSQYDLNVTTGPDEFVVVDCTLNNGLQVDDPDYVETTLRFQVVPEPSMIALLAMGAAALLWGRRRK